jgi:hypothetical protein
MHSAVFNIRARSLLRGTVLVIGSLIVACLCAGFPDIHPSPWIILPALAALYGTWETTRCLRPRWSFYHGGVMLLLYTDVLVVALILFLLLYPYARWIQGL